MHRCIFVPKESFHMKSPMSGFPFFRITAGRTVFKFSCKTEVLTMYLLFFSKKPTNF